MLRGSLCVSSVLLAAGCVTSGNLEILESRLRGQEARISELQSDLDEAISRLAIVRRENDALRNQIADRGLKAILPEQADVLFRATGIKFSSLMTGGLNQDEFPGHELLNVMLSPHDADGDVVKLPGRIQLDVFDLSRADSERLIGRWDFAVDESRKYWDRTLFGSGYQFSLPWQQNPKSRELLLHARLTAPDHREFNASTTIHIEPPSNAQRSLPDESHRSPAATEVPSTVQQFHRSTVDDRQERSAKTSVSHSEPPQPRPLRRIPDAELFNLTEHVDDASSPIQTSDRWTDETFPRLR